MSSPSNTVSNQSTKVVMRGPGWVVTLLCWFAVVFDGFDAVILGSTLPSMTSDPSLNMTDGQGTWVTTLGLVGMMIGGLSMGRLTDVWGRRKILMLAVLSFSIFTFATGFAQDPATVAILRFLAGLGLGGCLPTSISMVTEFAGLAKSSSSTLLVMSGYHAGAVATALTAIWATGSVVDGWRTMFFVAGLPIIILLPFMFFFLPESPQYLATKGRIEDARAVAQHYHVAMEDRSEGPSKDDALEPKSDEQKKGVTLLLSPSYRRNSLLIWIASFMGLLLIYGLNNYLPSIMVRSGYELGDSLGFLVLLNAGSVVGLLAIGRIGDKSTPRKAAIISFAGSAIFLGTLAIKMPLLGIYIMVFLAGCFVAAAQNLIYAFTAANHPPHVRGTAVGMSSGVGRLGAISGPLIGGGLLTAGLAYPWAFFAFATVGAAGAVSSLAVKTKRWPDKHKIDRE